MVIRRSAQGRQACDAPADIRELRELGRHKRDVPPVSERGA
jgi:hypothetical protein